MKQDSQNPELEVQALPDLMAQDSAEQTWRTLWAMLSSFALHSCWIALLLVAVVFLDRPPPPALVDFESLEFVEASASSDGSEGQAETTSNESLVENVENVAKERPRELAQKSGEEITESAKEVFQDTLEEATEASLEREAEGRQKIAAQLEEGSVAVQQGTQTAAALAQRAKDLMAALLEAEKSGGGGSKAGKKVPSVLERVRSRGDAPMLAGLKAEDVIVVRGCYDGVEHVLRHLDIPFTLINKSRLSPSSLDPRAVLVLNCDQLPLSADAATAVRNFVARGGYVFSSDWELHNVLTAAFPDMIGLGRQTRSLTVPIAPHPQSRFHPYLMDVFELAGLDWTNQLHWVVDCSSDTPVFKSDKVQALIVSEELAKSQRDNGVIAFTFRHGEGSVLHVLSHFRSQIRATGDGFALQQMLANFIIERQRVKKPR